GGRCDPWGGGRRHLLSIRIDLVPTYVSRRPGDLCGGESTPVAVVLALCAQVALVQLWLGEQGVEQIYGLQPHHLLVCDALELDPSLYKFPPPHKNTNTIQTP